METIDKNDKLTEGSNVIKEDFAPYYTDMYTAGQTKEQLTLGREVKGGVGGGNFKVLNKKRIATLGAIDYVVTGVGFKPKLIKIYASYYGGGYAQYSNGVATEDQIDGGYCKFYDYTGNYVYESQSRVIRVCLSSTSQQIAKLKSLDNDGFTLTFTISTGSDTISMIIECYG